MRKYNTQLISENIAPKNAKKIMIYSVDGKYLGSANLGQLKQFDNDKRYSFELISDVHIGYSTATEDFQRALALADDSDCLFTVITGDLTASGTDEQMQTFKDMINSYSKPVYAMSGNHETIWGYMTDERMETYTGHPLYYSFNQGDDVFIMVGHYGPYHGDGTGWLNNEFVSHDELQWLYETLEVNRNKRCFVFNHVYPYEDGVGDANRYYNGNYWSIKDGIGKAYIDLLKHYKNTTLFHGHSHLRFYLQERYKKANYADDIGYRSVHIPSISVPRDRVNETTEYIYAESEGYIVDVYDNYIILNGRDFIDNYSDGNILPIATYKIDTKLVTIEANTFTDSTGLIKTF